MKRGMLTIFLLLLIATLAQATAFEFCDDGIVGEDKLRIISVDDMLKDNAREWKWQESQNIEIEVRVENKADESKTT